MGGHILASLLVILLVGQAWAGEAGAPATAVGAAVVGPIATVNSTAVSPSNTSAAAAAPSSPAQAATSAPAVTAPSAVANITAATVLSNQTTATTNTTAVIIPDAVKPQSTAPWEDADTDSAFNQPQKPAAPAASNWSAYTVKAVESPVGLKSEGSRVLQLSLADEKLPQYGASFEDLSVEITPETETRLHVKIQPTGEQRWEVPESIVPRPGPAANLNKGRTLYDVRQPSGRSDDPFALTVLRKSTGERIFDTTGHPFLFKDQYIELTTTIPKMSSLYGIGETSLNTGLLLPRNGSTITLWNRDSASAFQNINLYGSHPFYLQVNKDGSSHGVFMLNSNGMDITITETELTYRIIGGLVDLYFFMGPTPEAVIRQYHQVIGAPVMPPYWTLGLHQSKWGYPDISTLEEVAANYSAAGLPLESLWVDIEYMQSRFRTMTFDEERYPAAKMKEFVKKLHAKGQSWVPILDPAVSIDPNYRTYMDGTKDNVWMKDYKGETYVGQVWPGMSVYPDYLSAPNMTKWLTRELRKFHDQVPFDGLWLDMCEPSNFCTGMNCKPDPKNATALYWLNVDTPKDYLSIARSDVKLVTNRTSCQMVCEQPAVTNSLAHPPYQIKNGGMMGIVPLNRNIVHPTASQNSLAHPPYQIKNGGMMGIVPLNRNIVHPTAKHADGTTEYDAHNLYGTAMAMRHYEAAAAVTKKRPFILTRSTSPGAGRFTGHWTGDNAADWSNLYISIAGIINTNFWGMSMAGSDICGYVDMLQSNRADPANQTLPDDQFQELCNRWTSAGAFYPFSRNHMIIYSRPHEFYRWPDVTAAAKKAYGLRYQLLTYFYTGLFMAHTRGGTLARPLLFTHPSDLRARNETQQWMMGEAVLISPVISHNTTIIKPYFTAGNWYSAWDYEQLKVKKGRNVAFNVPRGDIPVHFRGGAIIPMQRTAALPNVTRDVRFTPVTLVVTLPAETSWGSGGVAMAVRDADGPLPPYILEEPCADAHKKNDGKYVSCGMLYMDRDDLVISSNNTLQVFYTAVTGELARSGTVENLVMSNGLKTKIKIRAIHILGVPGTERDVASASIYGKPNYSASYDHKSKVVKISGIDFDAGRPLTVDWWLRSIPKARAQAQALNV